MTKITVDKALIEQALEAFEQRPPFDAGEAISYDAKRTAAILGLRAALAKPAVESVVWLSRKEGTDIFEVVDPEWKSSNPLWSDAIPFYASSLPPAGVPLTWIKTSEQYPPAGVRVFWFNPQYNQVGYDTWMGSGYKFNAEYWMHIPEIGKAGL